MATAPLAQEAPIDNDAGEIIDFESEARKIGWVPADEFRGDASRHVDAETFYKRGQEVMPILKAQNKRLERELADIKKQLTRASDFFSKSEQRGYERAMAEINAKREAAFESGDKAAFTAADKEADDLRKEMSAATKPGVSDDEDIAGQRAEEFADWSIENSWYQDNAAMRTYMDAQAELLAKKKGGFLDKADLDSLSAKVRDKFAYEADEKAAPRQKKPMVDSGGQRQAVRGGKTFNDLPQEAKAAADKWIKQGLIKSREDYVKAYQW